MNDVQGCLTLAGRMKGKEPDYRQLLKDLIAKQTALFNANAPEQERIEVLQKIQEIQQRRKAAER